MIGISKLLQLLHHPEDSVIRKVLHRLYVKRYHFETERLQSISRVVGTPPRVCNLCLQIVQLCQVCRPWKCLSQRNKLIGSFDLSFQGRGNSVRFVILQFSARIKLGMRYRDAGDILYRILYPLLEVHRRHRVIY